MTHSWDADLYRTFLDVRTRPAKDLLAAIPSYFDPKLVYDLGCGPGNSTILLKKRWPNAKVIGTDNSVDMLKKAREDYPEIEFLEMDIEHFSSTQKIDCLFSNASLQWCNQHHTLIPRLIALLAKNGILAIQMPNNFHAATHQAIITILKNYKPWSSLTEKLRYGFLEKAFYNVSEYYNLLSQAGLSDLQLWETEYFVEMDHHTDIFNWIQGTGLRPILSELDETDQKLFEKKYNELIANQYPLQQNKKILMPFMRFFMVGVNC